jgi:hypothetical protein
VCFAKFNFVFERRLHGRLAESERGGGGRFTGVSPEIQSDLINCPDSVIDEILKEINDCMMVLLSCLATLMVFKLWFVESILLLILSIVQLTG